MAIQTETTYEVKIGTETVDTIGLSNTLDTYTWDEIKDYNYVGSWTECYRQISHRSPSDTTYIGYASTVGDCPFAASWYGGYTNFNISGYGTSLYNFDGTHGIYRKLILLNDSTDNYPTVITVNNRSNFKIITEFDAKKYALEYDAVKMLDSTFYTLYDGLSHQTLKYHTKLGQPGDDDSAVLISFRPYFIIEFENTYYCLRADIVAYRTMSASYLTNSGMAQCYNNLPDVSNTNSKYTGICEAMENWFSDTALQTAVAVPFIQNANTNNTYYCSQEKYIMKIEFGVNNSGFLVDYAFKTEEDLLLFIAGTYGIHFIVNETIYKPIIIDNFVVAYTTNLDEESDLDNYSDTNHDMPVTPPDPPTPPPGPGYDDDPWSGVSFSGVGLGGGGAFARCYYMTSTELANLRSWMCGINVPEGFNPMAQIIGLSQVPVALSGDAPETVQFINSSAVYDPGVTSRVVDSNVSTQYSMGSPIKYSLGSVDIVRRMQERGEPYLDYSCQIELYLPLIGMFSLDTQAVMGRTMEAEAILDPISGTLAAYAWVSKDGQKLPVAYGSTTISVDLPVTAQQYSVSKAALKQANAQLGTSILSSVATLVAAAVGAGKAEGSNARVSGGASSMQGARGMNSYAQASSIAASQAAISQTGNIVGDFMQWGRTIKQLQYGNNTAISGSFGGSVAQWSYPFQAYVKINRPRYEKPENYAHTQGVPCVQKKRIGDCTGFIQCIGVDVDNHIEGATDLERQAIQAALSSGIYAGGGGE